MTSRFAVLLPPLLMLASFLIAADPEVRPPTGSATRPLEEETPADSLPRFGELVEVEDLPEAVQRPAPSYPEAARRAGVQGTVVVQALVGKDGLVKATRIASSIPALDAAAEASVRRWTFKPARNHGRPVAVWVAVPVRFRMDPGSAPPDPQAALRDAIDELRREGPRPPSERDAILRERIVRIALELATPPAPPDAALRHLAAADSLMAVSPAETRRAIEELAAAIHAAPWWAQPHRRIAAALESAGRYAEAAVALDLFLVADPRTTEWEQSRRKLAELRSRIAGVGR